MRTTPYLTHFPNHLFGSAKTSAQAVFEREARRLRDMAPCDLARELGGFVPSELLEQHSATRRRRHFPDPVTFWGFLGQALCEDRSCSAALARLASWSGGGGAPAPQSANTGAWCQARKRLPEGLLDAVHGHLLGQLDGATHSGMLWRGHRVKALDGSSVALADTPENAATYPLATGQKEGCGHPVMHVVGLLDLCHGGWEGWVVSEKRRHDLSLARPVVDMLEPGDVLLGDRGFCSYELVATLGERSVHPVFRLHQRRKIDKRRAHKLGPGEWLVEWAKPAQQPAGSSIDRAAWGRLAATMSLRLIEKRYTDRYGRRATMQLVTTLTDPVAHPAAEVLDLYMRRWQIETRLRDLKTTMGMETLRARNPEMALKELRVFVVAYNLVRLLMLHAGLAHGIDPERISYKGTIQLVNEYAPCFRRMRQGSRRQRALLDELLARIAARVVPERPGRSEPRAVKRRPKPFAHLTKPRRQYKEIPHREHHRKPA